MRLLIPQLKPAEAGKVICLVPSHCFFYKTVSLPESLKPSEYEDFLSVQLEAFSPFPLEQLAWGYRCGLARRRVLIYAAQQKRIQQTLLNNPDLLELSLLVPDCYPYLHNPKQAGTLFYRRTLHSALLLEYKEYDCVPDTILAIAAQPEQEDTELFQLLNRSFRRYYKDFPDAELLENYCYELTEKKLYCERGMRYLLANASVNEDSESLVLDPVEVLHSDVRDRDWLHTRYVQLVRSQWASKVQAIVAILLVLLMFAQGFNFVQKMRVSSIEAALMAQAEKQAEIESQQALVFKLESVASETAQPFYRLAAASKVLPATIFFDTMVLDSLGQLRIEANADTIATINRYEESLRQAGVFEHFEISGRESRQGTARFVLSLGALKTPSVLEKPNEQVANAQNSESIEP